MERMQKKAHLKSFLVNGLNIHVPNFREWKTKVLKPFMVHLSGPSSVLLSLGFCEQDQSGDEDTPTMPTMDVLKWPERVRRHHRPLW